MAKTIIVQMIDDLDGSAADETARFGLDGKTYEIDLNKKNAAALRKALAPYVAKAATSGTTARAAKGAGRTRSSGQTLYSQLSDEEKERFRTWAKMPDARRIGDARVQSWIDAGRP